MAMAMAMIPLRSVLCEYRYLDGGRCDEAEGLRSDVEACVSQKDWFSMLRNPDTCCNKEMVGCWLADVSRTDERGKPTMTVRLGVVRDRDPDASRWNRKTSQVGLQRQTLVGKEAVWPYLRFTGPRRVARARESL
jgi:hypothetical protein